MTDRVLMEDMSWVEIEESIAAGKDTVLLLVGAIAQHGPHLPISTCLLVGYAWGERIARKLGNALVAPLIRPTCSSFHMGHPGTISLRLTTLIEVINDYCDSLASAGFRQIVLIPAMGSIPQIDAIAPELARKYKSTKIITYTEIRTQVMKTWTEIAAKFGVTPEEIGTHAGDGETSVVMAVRPDLVNMKRAAKGFVGDTRPFVTRLWNEGARAISENGIVGDPMHSSAQRGEAYLEGITDMMAEEIRARMVPLNKKS